ncbi:ABC transporter permease [Coralliovum pocilloporae]|uniref:ABC transporter permease n=1 Tax=Coralliovum pocilloporae TaxID=3066369 RepID=UPI003306F967
MSAFNQAMIVQMRVLGALVLREARATYGDTKFGLLWAIAEPAAGIALLVTIFSAVGRHPALGQHFAMFFATGILAFTLYKHLSSKLMKALQQNQSLLSYPVINELDILIARIVVIVVTNIAIMLVFFSVLNVTGYGHYPKDIATLLMAFFSGVLLGVGVGVCNLVLFRLFAVWSRVETIISRPMFFISGIFFIPDSMPPNIRYFLSWNPVVHLIDWFRTAFYPTYHAFTLEKWYLLTFGLTLTVLGLIAERFTRRYVS